jgi:hypothetical protein
MSATARVDGNDGRLVSGIPESGLPEIGSNRCGGRIHGTTRTSTKRATAPMVHQDGFDKAIVYAAVLQVPVAFG